MKKIFVVGLVLGTFVLTSCKKDWTCECTGALGTYSSQIKDKTKKDATEECDKGTISILGYSQTCKIN
ncbi:MAG: hypothetical protein M9916_04010 [Crocinitomicaceae bacterium]|nr:hypothetical protein [Crocinitomicaceae bacterium]